MENTLINVNDVIDVRRKVDALLEEESDMEQEVLIDKKRKRGARSNLYMRAEITSCTLQ